MLKFFYTLLTDPLGLPLEPIWEYFTLAILSWIVHEIAWSASPGGRLGSLIYWGTKLLVFVLIWAILYIIISALTFVIAHWIWFLCGVVFVCAIAYWISSR